MVENKKVPEIRFKGFTEDWEQRKVEELFKITRGYVLSATLTSESKDNNNKYPVYSSQTQNNGLMGYYNDYLYDTAITWTTDGANAGTVKFRPGKFYCTNVCGVLLSDKGYANKMMGEALNNIAKKYVSYVGNPKLMNNVMAEIPLNYPNNLNEQNQISNLFQNIDNLITLHQRKYEKLVNFKKSMLEKMFPQTSSKVPEIRFNCFTEDWEQRKFENYGTVSMCKRIFKNETSDNGDIPFYKIGTFGNQADAFISNEKYEYYKSHFSYPNKGDILLSASGTIGRIVEYTGEKAYFQDSNIVWLNHNDNIKNSFLKVLYPTVKWDGIEGSTIKRLYNSNFLNTEISIPKTQEQEKIGLFFSNIDNLITLHQRKLEKLNNIKKSMLDKMFV